jgi:hypothetical protein
VAANDCHYLYKEQAELHDILLCGLTGRTVADEERLRFPSPEYYFKSPAEMAAVFPDLPEALANTLAIAERCQVEFPPETYRGPPQAAGIIAYPRFNLRGAFNLTAGALGLGFDLGGEFAESNGGIPAELVQAARDNLVAAKLLVCAAELENLPVHPSIQSGLPERI